MRVDKMKKQASILTLFLFISAGMAQPTDVVPTEFYGNVSYDDGTEIDHGTVKAVVGSEIKSSAEIVDGEYEMVVQKNTSSEDFEEVLFVVNETDTGQVGEFEAFKSQRVDLTIPAPEEDDSSDSDTSGSGTSSFGGFSGGSTTGEQPVAGFTWETPVRPGETVEFDASGSFDPDGNLTDYRWSFGATGVRAENVFGSTGTHTVNLTVEDSTGLETTVSKDVVVEENQEPVARFDVVYTDPDPAQDVRFNASGSYDPDGEIVDYSWNFGQTGETAEASFPEGEQEVVLTVVDDEGAVTNTSRVLDLESPDDEEEEDETGENLVTGSFASSVSDTVSGLFSGLGQVFSLFWPF
jgi:hypothetical protein